MDDTPLCSYVLAFTVRFACAARKDGRGVETMSNDQYAKMLVATARAVLRSPENVVPLKLVALAMQELRSAEQCRIM